MTSVAQHINIENLNDQDRNRLGEIVLDQMEDWGLSKDDQLTLLGLEGKSRSLSRYRHGHPLPDDPDVLERVRHLLGIGEALRGYFPLNHKGGSVWLRHTNKYFHKKPPLRMMLEDGLIGMHRVWVNLDCTQGWD